MRTASLSYKLEPELLDRLRRIAAREERTLSWLTQQAVREYVERVDKPAPPRPKDARS
jgi:predicted transcriptional regulator